MDEVLRAIAEPQRGAILDLVQDQEMTAGAIAEHFDVTRPAISQHLKVLIEAGLVTVRPEGTRRLYRIRPKGLNEVSVFLNGFWDLRLEMLKDAAEAEEEQARNK